MRIQFIRLLLLLSFSTATQARYTIPYSAMDVRTGIETFHSNANIPTRTVDGY